MNGNKKRRVARSPEDLARKRDLILDAAMRLLIGKGFTKITMSDVAREASVGRGTVYWHFDSKNELFFRLLEREVARFDEGFASVMEVESRAITKLESVVRASFVMYRQAPNLFGAFLSVLTGADEELELRIGTLFARMYGKYNELVESLLETAKREGDARPDLDSHVAAAAIVVMLDAMFLQIHLGLVENDPDRLAAGVLSLLRRGYLAAGKGGGEG